MLLILMNLLKVVILSVLDGNVVILVLQILVILRIKDLIIFQNFILFIYILSVVLQIILVLWMFLIFDMIGVGLQLFLMQMFQKKMVHGGQTLFLELMLRIPLLILLLNFGEDWQVKNGNKLVKKNIVIIVLQRI